MATRNTASDGTAQFEIENDTTDDSDDTRIIPLQPRHGPQPTRLQ
jgi:hypothetical protein